MLVRHHHGGKVYEFEVPEGSRVRRSEAAGESVVYVQTDEGEVPIFEEPTDLIILMAKEGRYGLRLLGVEEVPESDIREQRGFDRGMM